MEDITCEQSPLTQPYQPYFSQQYCYENRDILEEEEPESFIDAVSYSESDGYIELPMVRSIPSNDIQELYFRKPMMSSSQVSSIPKHSRCCLAGHCPVSTEYIYELKPRPPPHLPVVTTTAGSQGVPKRSSSAYATRPEVFHFSSSSEKESKQQLNTFSDASSFRSTSALPVKITGKNNSASPCRLTDHKMAGIKRCPVICKTARFVRRPYPTTSLRKHLIPPEQPEENKSTQQRRPPKQLIPPGVSKSQEVKSSREASPITFRSRTHLDVSKHEEEKDVRKINSKGDATSCNTNIDNMDTIERIVATLDENESEDLSEEHKKEIKKISQFLEPRVPSSVKALQQKRQKKNVNPNEHNGKDETEKGKIADKVKSQISFKESLDNILDQLENCELSLNAVRSKYATNRTEGLSPKEIRNKENSKEEQIFNLREISQKISKSSYSDAFDKTTTISSASNRQYKSSEEVSKAVSVPKIQDNSSTIVPDSRSRGYLDDVTAMELHRSKSYIVNLIDRALSKELGTLPKEQIEKRQFQDLTPTKAINSINRSCRLECNIMNLKKDHAVSCRNMSPDSKHSDSSVSTEGEPAYIKQLKELRWGHFKHIQQEVKRLEDLERFLDTCATPCGSSY